MPGSRRFSQALIVATVLLLVAVLFVAQKIKLPKPQVASAEGQPVPDFTLNDQDGRPFHLADLRGTRVVLVFYRGYW